VFGCTSCPWPSLFRAAISLRDPLLPRINERARRRRRTATLTGRFPAQRDTFGVRRCARLEHTRTHVDRQPQPSTGLAWRRIVRNDDFAASEEVGIHRVRTRAKQDEGCGVGGQQQHLHDGMRLPVPRVRSAHVIADERIEIPGPASRLKRRSQGHHRGTAHAMLQTQDRSERTFVETERRIR
jgi:hypothetical protein